MKWFCNDYILVDWLGVFCFVIIKRFRWITYHFKLQMCECSHQKVLLVLSETNFDKSMDLIQSCLIDLFLEWPLKCILIYRHCKSKTVFKLWIAFFYSENLKIITILTIRAETHFIGNVHVHFANKKRWTYFLLEKKISSMIYDKWNGLIENVMLVIGKCVYELFWAI